jgi:PIN domain nuclease of toxin-antitoxin system
VIRALLLDTHAFLWIRSDHAGLPDRVRRSYSDPASAVYLSLASVWELAIKVSIGKLEVSGRLRDLVDSSAALGIRLLPIELDHVLAVERLPFHHRDPFDRLLVVQARASKLVIVSGDSQFDAYDITRLWD